MSKYLLHGSLTAKPNCQNQLIKILIEALNLMILTKGCELYTVSLDPHDANSIWVTEIWETKADHDTSLSEPGVKELITKAMPLLGKPPTKGQELNIVESL